jgi:drug/metabolite transporter (DMT)-like permease
MNKKVLAIIFMLLSALSFSIMGVMVKQVSNLPLVESVFFRNLVSVFIALYLCIKSKIPLVRKEQNTKLLVIRSLLGLIGVMGYFYSIRNLPLADAAILNRMSPFFVLIFSYFILKEHISKSQIFAVILAFFGIALVIRPGINYSILPSVIGLGAAVIAGLAYTVVKKVSYTEHPSTIVFYFSAISAIVMLPLLLLNYVKPSLMELLYLVLMGVFAAGGQYGLTYSYKMAKASEVSIYSYATVIFSALIGYFLWQEKLSILSIIGICIVIISGYLNFKFSEKTDEASIEKNTTKDTKKNNI